MSNTDFEFEADIMLEFVAEALEHLEGIDQQLMDFEQSPEDPGLIDGIFRAIHSIKGSSGFLGLGDINKLSHRLETLLDQLRKKEKTISPEIMDTLFQGCDILKTLVEEINNRLDQNLDLSLARDDEHLTGIYGQLDSLLDSKSGGARAAQEGVTDQEAGPPPPIQAASGYTITPQMLQDFQVEASEHLESCDQGLVRLVDDPGDVEAVHQVFRDMHSVKGTASYLGLTTISELAHAAESMLEILRRTEDVRVTNQDLDLLFETLDRLKEMVVAPETPSDKVHALAQKIEKRKEALEKNSGAAAIAAAPRPSTDPLAIFLDAAEQHITTLQTCLVENGAAKDKVGQVDIMFRAAHSLKSSAQYMGFDELESKAATIEETLESVRDGELEMAPVIYDLVTDSVAAIEKALAAIKDTGKAVTPETPAKLTAPPPQEQAPENKLYTAPAPASSPAPAQQTTAAISPQPAALPKTMRVDQTLLDSFMNLVGELIVARNAFGHIERRLEMGEKERAEALKELRSASQAVARISEEMQRTVMEMRMVPIRNVFQKFPRMVRDLTRKTGKQAQIILQGEETEIDKGIAEDLADPLVHIIRNCVDHGLESPDERKVAGKSKAGTIILRAAHEGNFIIIDIIDDGRGIDTETVLAKAIEKGMISREQAGSLSHEEICGFIFKPGFSTAKKVTDISGRGVGMDVVMTNLKKLKGNVRVTSESGQGTKVRLEVPLTLALVDAL
ncbi:MAG: chemotaxis protein CheA, partial [Deltaproteobacteria bacterium]|nr:chemotaxis protein CheA [Deltaproteobacteria bacterium]